MDPQALRHEPAPAVPRTVTALISTDPRVIADEVWAKLLWRKSRGWHP
ncbi:hypothetical protein [Streptomyces albus]